MKQMIAGSFMTKRNELTLEQINQRIDRLMRGRIEGFWGNFSRKELKNLRAMRQRRLRALQMSLDFTTSPTV